MPPTHLVDTDCVIHYFHQIPSVTKRIIGLGPSGIAVSIISVAELWEGVLFSDDLEGDQQELESFLAVVTVVGIDPHICRRFGALRGTLRRQRKPIADFDIMIAATALEYDLTLLSNNRRHFEYFPGLRLESIL
ncbi:MAG: type II toxin-antitoxin system VapC family toxin [Candidatus Acidiferrales bacterium]